MLVELLVTGSKRRDGFIPFLRTLVQSEIQTTLSEIWTSLVFIFYDNNHYSTCTTLQVSTTPEPLFGEVYLEAPKGWVSFIFYEYFVLKINM